MFRLLIAPLVAATFCAVYWAAGSIAIDLALAAWRDNPSVRFDYSAASTSGFPARFQTRITEIEFQDADTGLGWAAPVLTLSAPTLHPTQVSAVFARSQSIRTRHGRISITSDAMRGAIDVDMNPIIASGTPCTGGSLICYTMSAALDYNIVAPVCSICSRTSAIRAGEGSSSGVMPASATS